MGAFRAMYILTVACLAIGFLAPGSSARLEGRWALQAGDAITGEDFSVQHPVAEIYHQQSSSLSGLEHYDASFSSGIPFGPVSIALPSIQEENALSLNSSSSGFFAANWAYISDVAAGNAGAEPLGIRLASGHPLKSNRMLGSEFIWPYMMPIAKASTGSLMLDVNSLASPGILTGSSSMPEYGSLSASLNNAGKLRPGWGERRPRVSPGATKEEIKNMTTLQRVYRNAFIGSTMHKAYEGPTQYPEWIDPYDNGKGVFNQIDMNKILQNALKKTRPGERIAPVFWDL
ncbi:hypothetical protein Mtc_2195 [Methanocella conradii HZ254]|uniref:Uncharacterized protein n=1 Tax=Methanocella conradii (strain DSM 24694 / JCM 17849 / CGMCC 1.5162 / HZ254) TaxID=1041930 RepID=H8I9X0_METCZ|nr:hypothetical protein [Methanocella conradii]AFD00930.1 hypothetical protein Mtc_2195 [Methanocella conradii HZ254]